jgi:hypothetical protein
LLKKLKNDMEKFYTSDSFKLIESYGDYHNEFEIYCKAENYFLYGIIDRLILDKNKAIIVDFKTDNIEKTEIQERFKGYLTQLKFYSYIVSRLFENMKEFELRLVFIKYPEEDLRLNLQKEELAGIKEEIDTMVSTIRDNSFVKNLAHCPECSFALNKNRCIIQ